MTQEKKSEIPKDLGVKLGTKEEAYWTNVKAQTEELIVKGRGDLAINEWILELAKRKIQEEKGKLLKETPPLK